jgi:vesicle coat complex subunit
MSKFFQSTTRGEAGEIKEDITSEDKARQKNALMRVIAGMTVGRDMSNVFSDVTKLMSSPAIDIKKLVYLYLMQYAAVQPDKAVLVAGSFVKDTLHESPLIRGLALRTMSSIAVDKMTEFLIDPLRRSLRDESDPYVKKCAAMAVLKMHSVSRQRVEDCNLLSMLMELFNDANSTVVANVAAAVNELRSVRGSDIGLEMTGRIASTLLNALNESSEWGQAYVLEALSTYVAPDREEAEMIVERILPRLQHGNAAVVMASVKLVVQYMEQWCGPAAPGSEAQKEEKFKKYAAKLTPAMVSLMTSHDVEVRYVALRNINLIVQRFPDILINQLKIFFVKYNDPIFVKLEKVDILTMLVAKSNVEQVLAEYVEYAQEVDVEFVRKSVRAIGMIALKIDEAAPECVQQLMGLIKTKVNYVVQEAVVVIRDIFRRYPNKYESIIAVLCENLETLDEPEAKSAMIWIVGEYSDRIENAGELLEIFMDNFEEETMTVKLSVLGAVVKLYLKRGAEAEALLQQIFKVCTESDIPDLRDRAFMYWRLLTSDADAAAQAIVGDREPISTDASTKYDKQLLGMLLQYVGTLSSIYHKPPKTLFGGETSVRSMLGTLIEDDDDEELEEAGAPQVAAKAGAQQQAATKTTGTLDLDMDDIYRGGSSAPAPIQQQAPPPPPPKENKPTGIDDFFAAPAAQPAAAAVTAKKAPATFLGPPAGLGITYQFTRDGTNIILELDFTNQTAAPAMGFQFQTNKNIYGVTLAEPINVPQPLMPNATSSTRTRLTFGGPKCDAPPDFGNAIQFAVKSSMGVAYFSVSLPFTTVLHAIACTQQEFPNIWRSIPDAKAKLAQLPLTTNLQRQNLTRSLQGTNFNVIGEKSDAQGQHVYLAAKTLSDQYVVCELLYDPAGSINANIRSTDALLLAGAEKVLREL